MSNAPQQSTISAATSEIKPFDQRFVKNRNKLEDAHKAMLYNTNTGSVESKQSSQARSFGNEKEEDPLKGMQNMTETQKIALLGDQINTQITDLDMKLDDVLAKHEKDFLKAYRFHMLKVQEELSTLK